MTEIVIIGSGGFAAEITTFFDNNSTDEHKDIRVKGYIDYEENIEKYWKRYSFDKPVLNDIDNYRVEGNEYFVIGIADNAYRRKMIDKINTKGGKFINLIHPTAIVDKKSIIGTGNIISPLTVVGPNVKIGDYNMFTEQTIISHDCVIGNNNFFSTAIICGHVHMGNDNYCGVRATVIPRIKIGDRNTIQAGMIVDKDVKDDSVVFHRFKEKVIAVPRD